MPSILGYGGFTSSDTSKVGAMPTRLRGPILVGQQNDNAGSGQTGPTYPAPHMVTVSTAHGDLMWPAAIVSSGATQGFVYIPQTTGTVTSSSGTSNMSAPAPAVGSQLGGAAFIFDANRLKLCVYSTVAGSWLGVTLTSS